MEPNFKTSFIPKKPIVSTQGIQAPVIRTTSVFSLVASVVFIVTLIVSGGLYFYTKILNDQILAADTAVNEARAIFELDKIQELIDANSRMMSTNGLLEAHVAVSELLVLLQDITLRKIRFEEFAYKTPMGVPTLSIKTEAQSYNALATQGEVFFNNPAIKNPAFQDFSPKENGYVGATFSATLDKSVVSYKKAIESLSLSQ